jgi:2-iminobutanoate/2-iminopropanoate deaminase
MRHRKGGTIERSAVFTASAPKPIGPYNQAIATGNLVFCSGQVGLDPATGTLVEGGVEAQARQAMKNLGAVLEAAGSSLGDILKTTIYLVDMGDFGAVNAVYGEYLGDPAPARSTVAVAALPAGAKVEIDAIARI